MRQRCYNPKHGKFPLYGARGISVCALWRRDYAAFLGHVGRAPTAAHSLDRIENNGHYEPGNVRWATATMQANNRRVGIDRHRFSHTEAVAAGRKGALSRWAKAKETP